MEEAVDSQLTHRTPLGLEFSRQLGGTFAYLPLIDHRPPRTARTRNELPSLAKTTLPMRKSTFHAIGGRAAKDVDDQ